MIKVIEFITKYISKMSINVSVLPDGKMQICLVFDPKDIKI